MAFDQYDDVISVSDITDRVDELKDQEVPRYVAGWNMPGYMPDMEPAEFDSFEDAKRFIIDAIKQAEESAESESEAEDLASDAENINLESDEFSQQCGSYVYWVTQDGTMGLDEDEQEELEELESLLSDLCGNGGDHQWRGDWYPATLIRDSYFVTYAQELADDIGAINSNMSWPLNCIDWDQAARELRMDYSSVEWRGVDYWYR